MRIEPISYQPYIYNTNRVSSNSMSRVKPIGEDLLASKTDFSGLAKTAETTNPLRRGETVNFADVLMMQMQMGRMNADRLLKPAETGAEEMNGRVVQTEQTSQQGASLYRMQQASAAYEFNMAV